jgi:hypothetical protein
MNRTQAQLALLKYSALVFAVLGLLTAVSVWDARPTSSPSVILEELAKRVPASIPRLLETPKPDPIIRPNFEVLQLPCLNSRSAFKAQQTDSHWLRISSELCAQANKIIESHLENQSNGFVATVFLRTTHQFTSDFIPLNEGANDLRMELTLASGEKYTYQWKINRSIASN